MPVKITITLRNSNEMSIEILSKKVYSDTKKNWTCNEWM